MQIVLEEFESFIEENKDYLVHLFETQIREFKLKVAGSNDSELGENSNSDDSIYLALKRLRDEIKSLFLINSQKISSASDFEKNIGKVFLGYLEELIADDAFRSDSTREGIKEIAELIASLIE